MEAINQDPEALVNSVLGDVVSLQDGLWELVLELATMEAEMKRKDDRIRELKLQLEELSKQKLHWKR